MTTLATEPAKDYTKELPEGCFGFTDHERITAKDINWDRPRDQTDVSTERALSHKLIVQKRRCFLKKPYWVVLSSTTYEMAGKFHPTGTYWGGRAWAETDLTGLEWKFTKQEDADKFAYHRD